MTKKNAIAQALYATLATLMVGTEVYACTRAVYVGLDNTVITVRSMDWYSDVKSNLWAFPRGMKREGAAGANSVTWTSKYGSVVTAAWEIATADGMNEKGLVANIQFLAESKYPKATSNDSRKPLSLAAWTQYVLDNYATVAEAVADLRKEPFYITTALTPDGHPGAMHLSISDSTGDSAILQYIDGKLVIHHGKQYQVMTNSPIYDQQLALDDYWKEIGGATMLPGTNRAADRFVRASYYVNTVTKTANNTEAIATAFSIIRSVSVPIGISTPGKPNISQTIWRTVSDHKNKRYYFESSRSPSIFWVNLADIDFTAGKPSKKLTLTDGTIFAGNTAAQFKTSEPFKFLTAPAN